MPGSIYDALCVGILVADMFAPPLPRLPYAGELLRVDDMLLSTGGCAANTGADLVRLGARVAVVGKVGNDIFADFVSRDLRAKGLDISGLCISPTTPTSRTIILPVVGEDRRYIHMIGANAELTPADVDLDLVARSNILYVGGYQLFPGFDQASLTRLFQFARQRDIKTVLDVAGVHPNEGMKPFEQVLPLTDVFLPNDDEAALITGESDPFYQAARFIECGAGTVVITLGAEGAVACTRERALRAGAFKVNVVDPSGAGDAFDAGCIIGLLEGWDLERTVEFASAIGASACTRLGTTAGVFTRPEALDFLAHNRLPIERMT
ncbi:MAG: carbohydrate kinase family protein [Chloroflexi bacterium HGW-Chloroflexi-1]|nr:MAG: carbohydrate kinase family protein [Chloroflexi bacterium HGW-Chloroflexi-1]